MTEKKDTIAFYFFLILLIIAMFTTAGSGQVVSSNKEFSYNYVNEFTLVTQLGDSIHTGQLMPHTISDEGHPTSVVYYGASPLVVYYSKPWYQNNTLFVQYNKDGELTQSMLFRGGVYCYWSTSYEEQGFTTKEKQISEAILLWKNN